MNATFSFAAPQFLDVMTVKLALCPESLLFERCSIKSVTLDVVYKYALFSP
jgi:hypothetical protein